MASTVPAHRPARVWAWRNTWLSLRKPLRRPGARAEDRDSPGSGRALLALGVLIAGAAPASAQDWSAVPATATFQTGDAWSEAGVVHRLYGVQACLRGTSVVNAHGQRRDCGEASLAMLVALIRDLRPLCREAAPRPPSGPTLVVCIAQPRAGAGAGFRIDLGTALIASGFAFAALGPDGRPVHEPYAVAQAQARRTGAGLWAFPDLPDPTAIIRDALARTRVPVAGRPADATQPLLDLPGARQ